MKISPTHLLRDCGGIDYPSLSVEIRVRHACSTFCFFPYSLYACQLSASELSFRASQLAFLGQPLSIACEENVATVGHLRRAKRQGYAERLTPR